MNSEGLAYVVRLSGQDDRIVLERDLDVRCFEPSVDPTAVLASGGFESQFLHDRRIQALAAILRMRASIGPITGLVSASVILAPHHVEVVRRILTDPLQRYLLADEVGLGKTIEAGAILRQLILDEPDARAVIVTPKALVWQWEQELAEKFDLIVGREVTLIPVEDLPTLRGQTSEFTILVVDEAHHLIPRTNQDGERYALLSSIAHAIPRVLLLTATPVLSDEYATLRLLHLLDRIAYPIDQPERFREKLAQRQEFGELMIALDPTAPLVFLRATLDRLVALLSADELVQSLAHAAAAPNLDPGERARLIRDLRDHISDTYRLHHRLLRTRRSDVDLPDRSPSLTVDVDEDERTQALWSAIEDWRESALDALRDHTDPERAVRAESIHAALFEALGRGADSLARLLQERAEELDGRDVPCFEREASWVRQTLALCSAEHDGMDRVELASEASRLMLTASNTRRIVVFATDTELAEAIAGRLSHLTAVTVRLVLGRMNRDEIEDAIIAFQASKWPAILVADTTGEEGLNLHDCDGIVHADLPLAPSRVEQRIGRVDRFGRASRPLRQRVIIPSDADSSPWLAWLEVLREGLGVFRRSISDVQFFLDRVEENVRSELFRRGAPGVLALVEGVQSALLAERHRLDQQHALDQLDLEAEDALAPVDALLQEEKEEIRFSEDVDAWLHEVLRLYRRRVDSDRFTVDWNRRTLAPEVPWRDRFVPALDRPITYKRQVALRHPDTRLIRPGFPLVDELERLLRRDDRGSAFATWRSDGQWPASRGIWLGFRLSFVVEIDEDRLRELHRHQASDMAVSAIVRQASALFPPWMETLYLDAALEEVHDPLLSEILERPYAQVRDTNLASRPQLLYEVIDRAAFAALCLRVRAEAETALRRSPQFAARLSVNQRRAGDQLARRLQRIARRLDALTSVDIPDPTLVRESNALSTLETAINEPRLRLEAIGCFVISRERPSETNA